MTAPEYLQRQQKDNEINATGKVSVFSFANVYFLSSQIFDNNIKQISWRLPVCLLYDRK